MKKLILIYAVTFFIPHLFAQNYSPADKDSDVKFSIKNFGITVTGSFKGLKGKFYFDPANLAVSSITASVEVANG